MGVSILMIPYEYVFCGFEGKPALLFEYKSLTPRPVLVWVMVLYSPSSSSLSA
jgi:hypothetical protein